VQSELLGDEAEQKDDYSTLLLHTGPITGSLLFAS